MRFAFDDDQLAFRDAVRDLLEKECPASIVREAWTNDDGRTDKVWGRLADMGVLGALVPERNGGLGLTELDVVLLAEECGRFALPEPFVEHVMVGAPIVATEAAASGVVTITAGAELVPYAASADLLVIDAGHAALADSSGVRVDALESVDPSRRLGKVTVETPLRALTTEEQRLAFDRGALGTAAQLVGLAQHLLDVTVEYATARHQFGVAIGSFQAVKHRLADVRLALEFARPVLYRAATSMATGDTDCSTHVSMAKARAADTAGLAARAALQVHGAIGYSYEYDLHLWMKRAWTLAPAWGDAAWHRARVGRAILDRPNEHEEH